jgi:hypothetical protein
MEFFDDGEELVEGAVRSEEAPYFIAAVQTGVEVGGNRGVFAQKAISAGSMIVIEWPSFTWPSEALQSKEQLFQLASNILDNETAHSISKKLHPITLDNAYEDEIQLATSQLTSFLEAIPDLNQRNEILRIYLVLQHNGFQSGLYHILCMINHNCHPNCIKFEPRQGSRGASEVWSIRSIAKDEEITICYCSPIESSFFSSQQYLQQQHRFQCHCQRCISHQNQTEEVVILKEESPIMSIIEIEDELQEFEHIFHHKEQQQQLQSSTTIIMKFEDEFVQQTIQRLKELQCFFSECLVTISVTQLIYSNELRMLIRINKLFVTLYSLLLQELSSASSSTSSIGSESTSLPIFYAQHLAYEAVLLYDYQCQLYGHHHPDLAATLQDLLNAFDILKSFWSSLSYSASSAAMSSITIDPFSLFIEKLSKHFPVNFFPISIKELKDFLQFMKNIKEELYRIKQLYTLAIRAPYAVKVKKDIGVVIWGQLS